MRKRNRHVSVWTNDGEYRHLKQQARAAGMGIPNAREQVEEYTQSQKAAKNIEKGKSKHRERRPFSRA